MIAKYFIEDNIVIQVVYFQSVHAQKQPEILKKDKRRQQAFDFMEIISKGDSLDIRYEWQGNEVVIRT